MSLRAVVTADWHLDGMNKSLSNATDVQIRELHKPFRYAQEHGIPNVFIPGDASDTPKLSEHSFIALLTLLLTYDSSLNVWYMLGNHDIHSREKASMDVLRVFHDNGFFKNFRLMYAPTVEKVDGVHVAFVPFPFLEVPKCPRPPLVFAHVETVGAIGDNGLPLRMKEDTLVRQDGDFVISGHIHQYQHLKKKRLVYCGSPYQKNFGESLPKGFIEFEAKYVSGKLKVDHTFINSKPGFTLETVVVKTEADWDLLTDDPSRRYKVLVDRSEVVIPKNLTTRYPNIVMINGIDTTVKVEMNRDGVESITNTNLPKISMKTGLVQYLKSSGLERDQRIMARSLVEAAMQECNV